MKNGVYPSVPFGSGRAIIHLAGAIYTCAAVASAAAVGVDGYDAVVPVRGFHHIASPASL